MSQDTAVNIKMTVDGYKLEETVQFKFIKPMFIGPIITDKAIPEHYEDYLGHGDSLTIIYDEVYMESVEADAKEVVADDYEKAEAYIVKGEAGADTLEVVSDDTPDPIEAGKVKVGAVNQMNAAANLKEKTDKYPINVVAGNFVVHQDAVVIDSDTQVKLANANKFGGNFTVGKKVKMTSTTPATNEVKVGDVNTKNKEANATAGPDTYKDTYTVGESVIKVPEYDPNGVTTSKLEEKVVDPDDLEVVEHAVDIAVPSVMCIKYDETLPDLVNITDWQGGNLSLMNAFTKTNEDIEVGGTTYHYKVYTMKMSVVISDKFYFHFK